MKSFSTETDRSKRTVVTKDREDLRAGMVAIREQKRRRAKNAGSVFTGRLRILSLLIPIDQPSLSFCPAFVSFFLRDVWICFFYRVLAGICLNPAFLFHQ